MVVYSNKKSTIQGSFARHNQSQRLTLLFTSGRLLPHFLFSIRAPTQIDTCVPVNESEHILKNERFKLPVLKIIYTHPEYAFSSVYRYVKTTMMCCPFVATVLTGSLRSPPSCRTGTIVIDELPRR